MEDLLAKQPENHGKPWTPQQESKLEKLGRTETAIYGKASELGKSLKPTNQSPYNRRK